MTPLDALPSPTPVDLGFRWPAEWELQRALWLTWPHNPDTWPGKFESVLAPYAQFVRHVAQFQNVELICRERDLAFAKSMIGDTPWAINSHAIETNDAWIRDYGPTFLCRSDDAAAGIDWGYNAWGGKYPPYDLDQKVAATILSKQGLQRFPGPIVLEGGAIEGNGEGWLITTESSVLDSHRNAQLAKDTAERIFAAMLGATECIWLADAGLAGDDTDGHIDQLARFISPQQVVVAVANDDRDENHSTLQRNVEQLREWRSRGGQSLEIVPLPTPRRRWCQGRRLPCSYCNFVFVNGAVIVPQFEDPADEQAIETLRECLPNHQIVPTPALDLVWGLGAMHCLSLQFPAGS